MKIFSSLIVFLFLSLGINAQALYTISGNLSCINAIPLEGVSVTLKDANGQVLDTALSNEIGDFTFSNLSGGVANSYSISFEYQDNALDGLSTFDVVMGARHILGRGEPLSPVQIYASDLNATNTLTTLDLVFSRRLILGLGDDPNVPTPKWIFLHGNNGNYNPEPLTIQDLQGNLELNWIAVKRGDINNSNSSCFN